MTAAVILDRANRENFQHCTQFFWTFLGRKTMHAGGFHKYLIKIRQEILQIAAKEVRKREKKSIFKRVMLNVQVLRPN